MPTISQAFNLGKSQPELDFADVALETDSWLFIDPFALSQRVDPWSQAAHQTLKAFFQGIIDSIKAGNNDEAKGLLRYLGEPNETRLGLSKNKAQGAGIGDLQAGELFDALHDSAAVRTGFLSSLEEAELMIDGIGPDKISDLTTNVIRSHLVEYTQEQCKLHGIPLQNVAVPPVFNSHTMQWEAVYADMPAWNGQLVMFVPKVIVRMSPAYDYQQYYRHYVLNFLQASELAAGSALVRTLKKGTKVVLKKDVAKKYPCTKKLLYEFSRDNPKVLAKYRKDLERLEKEGRTTPISDVDEPTVAAALIDALRAIKAGSAEASQYHRVMIGVLEFVLYPSLMNPKKEREIHDGRKRIDILMENGAQSGVFSRLHAIRKIPCGYVPIECKNYQTDIANPELDQIAGRFAVNRGQVGFVACRTFEDRALFVARCKDTFTDGRGMVLALDDATVIEILELIRDVKRDQIEVVLVRLVDEVSL